MDPASYPSPLSGSVMRGDSAAIQTCEVDHGRSDACEEGGGRLVLPGPPTSAPFSERARPIRGKREDNEPQPHALREDPGRDVVQATGHEVTATGQKGPLSGDAAVPQHIPHCLASRGPPLQSKLVDERRTR